MSSHLQEKSPDLCAIALVNLIPDISRADLRFRLTSRANDRHHSNAQRSGVVVTSVRSLAIQVFVLLNVSNTMRPKRAEIMTK